MQSDAKCCFDKIDSLNVQAWYSGTDHSLFSGLENYVTQSYHLDSDWCAGANLRITSLKQMFFISYILINRFKRLS
jgi:hypothetical protein